MARCAAYPRVPARERETGQVVIQRRSLPAAGGVALRAGLTELPAVVVVRLVTGDAVLGRAAVLVALVSLYAGDLPMPARERIGGRVVIKAGSLPAVGRVALRASLPKLPAVPVVRLMAGNAVLRSSRVLVALVALYAGHLLVPPGEGVSPRAVIEGDGLPALRCVALSACLTELPVVLVIDLVAGVAVLRGSAVLISGVALHAVCLLVQALQRICRRIMGKRSPLPAFEGVALCAVLA